jgi:type I restriction enzyme M protein
VIDTRRYAFAVAAGRSEYSNDVVRNLWSLCSVLRDDGVTYHEYLEELSYLIFLKLGKELTVEFKIPAEYRWDRLSKLKGSELLGRYKAALGALGNADDPQLRSIFSGSATRIKSGGALEKLLDGLSSVSWYDTGRHVIGDIYEGLIEKNATESRYGAGQYFTPRGLVEAMVTVSAPTPSDVVYDPAAGTAGFLISAGLHSSGRKQPKLLGGELVDSVHRMAIMNLVLHGLEGTITSGDSLSLNPASLKASLVLSNPPFGVRGGVTPDQQHLLPFPTNNKQLAFLQHACASLVTGGRAAIVVPDNVLFEGGIAQQIRASLLAVMNVHTILRLPPGIFYATGVKTSVLFIANTRPTDATWVYDQRAIGSSFSRKRRIEVSDFGDFIASYGDDPLGESHRQPHDHFMRIELADIRANGYRLDVDAPPSGASRSEKDDDPRATASLMLAELREALAAAENVSQILEESTFRDK